jgi:uncharacterized DUF497 family protein
MQFTWDEEKRQRNLVKHGLDFTQAARVFEGATFTFEDTRYEYGEQRFVTIGLLETVVVIVHTEDAEEIRIISMRKANKNEQKLYFKNLYG